MGQNCDKDFVGCNIKSIRFIDLIVKAGGFVVVISIEDF